MAVDGEGGVLHDLASVGTGGTVSVLLRFRWRTLVCSIRCSW